MVGYEIKTCTVSMVTNYNYHIRGLQWMQLKKFYYNQHMKPYQKDDFVKVHSDA